MRIAIAGYGKMGKMIHSLCTEEIEVTAVVDPTDKSPCVTAPALSGEIIKVCDAVIDFSSTSISLLVEEVSGEMMTPVVGLRRSVSILGYMSKKGRLSERGVEKAVESIRYLIDAASKVGAQSVHLISTASMRRMRNYGEVMEAVRAATGLPIKNLSGQDEAYADFADGFSSAVSAIEDNPRIAVLRTLSKAFGAAGARLGILISSPEVQKVFMKAKPPYNVPFPSQQAGIDALRNIGRVRERIKETRDRRTDLASFLSALPYTMEVFPSEANFMLFRVPDAAGLYSYLLDRGIVVRNRSSEPMLENTIRITIGSEEEMAKLKEALSEWNY